MIFIYFYRPYQKDGGTIRPILNYLVVFIIQTLIFFSYHLSNKNAAFYYYAPIAIIGLLLFALTYNIYLFVKTFREKAKK